jgi:hypothetical protein
MRIVQFKKGKKRAKAQEEAEAMYLAGANSALCIALAKMHMTVAVEQVRRRRCHPRRPCAEQHQPSISVSLLDPAGGLLALFIGPCRL